MKVNRLIHLAVLALAITLPAAGCKKKPVGVTQLPNVRQAPVGQPRQADMAGTSGQFPPVDDSTLRSMDKEGVIANDPNSHVGWNEDPAIFAANRVFFDFDSSVVKSSEIPKVSAVADYLKGNAAAAVRVEGHCDERGTEEYNRALGERRAIAIREEMVRLGVAPTRVDTMTFGEDRPLNPGHEEAAYQQNRRGEFILLTPPR